MEKVMSFAGMFAGLGLLGSSLFGGNPEPKDAGGELKPDKNTVVLLHFNEGAGKTAKDEISGKVVDLKGVVWQEGRHGSSIAWTEDDGIGNSEIPIGGMGGDFTVEFQMRASSLPDSKKNKVQYEFDKARLFSAGGICYFVLTGSGKIYATINFHGTLFNVDSESKVELNRWTSVALTYDHKSRLICLYIDRKLDAWCLADGLPKETKFEKWGSEKPFLSLRSWAPNQWKYVGAIDELRISNIVRPEYEKPPLVRAAVLNYCRGEKFLSLSMENRESESVTLLCQVDGAQHAKEIPQGGAGQIDIPVGGLAGKTVRIRAEVRKGELTVQSFDREIKVVEAIAETFVKNGVVHHQGRPFFPTLMYFVYDDELEMVRKMGCNSIYMVARHENSALIAMPNNEPQATAMKKAIRKAADHDLAVIGVFSAAKEPVENNRKSLDTYSGEKNILMYYIADEPSLTNPLKKGSALDWLWQRYAVVKECPSASPAFLLCNNPASLTYYAQCGDIIAVDPYVSRDCNLDKIQLMVREMTKIADGRKATMAVVKAYNYDRNDASYPLYDELRAQVFISLAEGARGIGYYSFNERNPFGWHMGDHVELMNAIQKINAELAEIKDILLAPDSGAKVSNTNESLSLRLRLLNGRQYLIVANAGRERVNDVLSVDGSMKVKSARSLLNAKSYRVSENKIEVSLPRFGADVLEIQLSN